MIQNKIHNLIPSAILLSSTKINTNKTRKYWLTSCMNDRKDKTKTEEMMFNKKIQFVT